MCKTRKIHEIGNDRYGLLIAFEGLDGAGKSTQVKRLAKHLEKAGYPVVVTSWNSSKYISRSIKRAKKGHLLTPACFSALHAADFFNRLSDVIIPALNEGKIVLADRYSYTALARDKARGIDLEWVKRIYSLAIEPDIAFLCNVPVETALKRAMKKNGNSPKFYESGMDVSGESDPVQSFVEFQGIVNKSYQDLVECEDLVPIEMQRNEDEIFESIIEHIEPMLESFRAHDGKSPDRAKISLDSATAFSPAPTDPKSCSKLVSVLPEHKMPGKLIAIEGPCKEQVTHQVNALYDWFQVLNTDVVKSGIGESWITSEIIDKALSKNALSTHTNILLSASEMAYIMETEVKPALERGATVILNRFFLTIYVDGLLSGMNHKWLARTFRGFAVKPDAILFIDDMVEPTTEKLTIYRSLAEADGIRVIEDDEESSNLYSPIVEMVSREIGIDPKPKTIDKELREVLELYHKHNGYFEHAQKVRRFAVQIFDAVADIHGLNSRARRLLEYSALLHDVGRSVGDDHEKHSYRIIMDNKFKKLSKREKRIVAICALYHNGPASRLDNPKQWKLRAEEQLAVRKLAAILRVADALDSSDRQVIMNLRLSRERGALILDLNSVNKAKAERKSVLNKKDLFEMEFGIPVLVDRNRAERIKTKGDKGNSELFE